MFRPVEMSLAFLVIACSSGISSARTGSVEICFTRGGNCTRPVGTLMTEADPARLIEASRVAAVRLVNGWQGNHLHPFQTYYLRYQKARVAIPKRYTPMTFAEFYALPDLPEEYGQADWTTVRAYTERAVSVEGYIAGVRPSSAGDINAYLREHQQPRCVPDENRGAQIVTEVTRAFQSPKTGWSYRAFLDLCDRQTRVRFSGWLLHDFEHVQDVGDVQGSAWEIHPVTRIEVWDLTRHRWDDLR
jgi:hypothetical protein